MEISLGDQESCRGVLVHAREVAWSQVATDGASSRTGGATEEGGEAAENRGPDHRTGDSCARVGKIAPELGPELFVAREQVSRR